MAIDLQKMEQKFNALFEDENTVTEFEQWLKARNLNQNSGKPIVSGSLPDSEDDIWDDVQAMIEYTHDVDAIMQELKKHFVVRRQ